MLKLLLTCEHGGNQVPPLYTSLFEGQEKLLDTHQGIDIGALELFNELKDLADISFYSETTRLLVDLNRSMHHGKLFSSITKSLSEKEKATLIKNHYNPYREEVEQLIQDFVSAGRSVLHVAVHTFTPVLDGEERQADIGLLYDPKRRCEQNFCRDWKAALQQEDEKLLVRYNYPYLGISDGFPTYLRRKFSVNHYIGVELEVNQKFPQEKGKAWEDVKKTLHKTLAAVFEPKKASMKDHLA